MFFSPVKEKTAAEQLKPVYEIIPSPLYGWNFKCADSIHIIKYSKEQNELRAYATAYCRTHSSELVIYNYFREIEEVIRFRPEHA